MIIKKLPPPVFVVSTGRAGSTMLAQTLGVHPDLLTYREPQPHLNVEAFRAWEDSISTDRLHDRIEEKRSPLVEQAGWNRCTYVESSHYGAHLIQELHELYEARFVHLHRDGRAFVRSGLERCWWYPESYGDVFHRSTFGGMWEHEVLRRLRRRGLLDVGFSWNDHRLKPPNGMETRLEKISWLWQEINRTILDQLAELPADSFSMALEEFSEDVLASLLDFVGVSSNAELLAQMTEVGEQKPNRTETRAVPPFEQWPDADREAFWSVAGPMMQQLGYTAEDRHVH